MAKSLLRASWVLIGMVVGALKKVLIRGTLLLTPGTSSLKNQYPRFRV